MGIEQTQNRDAIGLVYAIELAMAEFTSGHWTAQQLHELLRPLTQGYQVRAELTSGGLRPGRPAGLTSSANLTVGEEKSSQMSGSGSAAASG
jgi:hypothetical protein